jgi:hypothetical protein
MVGDYVGIPGVVLLHELFQISAHTIVTTRRAYSPWTMLFDEQRSIHRRENVRFCCCDGTFCECTVSVHYCTATCARKVRYEILFVGAVIRMDAQLWSSSLVARSFVGTMLPQQQKKRVIVLYR